MLPGARTEKECVPQRFLSGSVAISSCTACQRWPNGRSGLLFRHVRMSSATPARAAAREGDHAAAAQEIVRTTARWQTGPCRRWAARATARPHNRPAPPGCNCPGKPRRHAGSFPPAARRLPWRCANAPAAISSARAAASSADRARIRAPNCSRLCRARSPRSRSGQLPLKFRGARRPARFAPSDQDTGARRMFGLGDQIGGDEVGPRPYRRRSPPLRWARRSSRYRPRRKRTAWPGPRTDCPARRSCRPAARLRRHRPAPPRPERLPCDKLRSTPSSWQVASRSGL